ncbi:MAG: hypothetical protein R2778_15470 [Saprospiraceae bacterium]
MNKKCLPLAALALLLNFFTQEIHAQASGVNPELYMYRHNSAKIISPTGLQVGDILGTLQWRGLTAIGEIELGATIKSFTRASSPGSLTADMIFSTNNGTSLTDRMIITPAGLVGIGTLTPSFNLDVVGNTHTSGRFHGRIHFDQLSVANDAPNTYTDEAYFEQKLRSTLAVPAMAGVNDFGGVLSLAPGGGAYDHQLFFGQDGIWNRREQENNGSWTDSWEKLLSTGDIEGTPNRLARFLPPDNPSSKLGDSQIFDDGTNVGIGTVTPDAAYLLTIGGDTRVTGDVAVDDQLTVGDDLTVSNDATVDGNTTLNGTLDVSNNTNLQGQLDVSGESNFDQRMKIGASNYGTGYLLSVGGKVIAEEVRVALPEGWPDYVFDNPTPDIKAWESFILENKHLPGVPSADEVEQAGGIELGENQRVLLEKVEQLTLIIIEQQKQIDTLQKQMSSGKQ